MKTRYGQSASGYLAIVSVVGLSVGRVYFADHTIEFGLVHDVIGDKETRQCGNVEPQFVDFLLEAPSVPLRLA